MSSDPPYRSHPELERLRAMFPDVVVDEEMRARLAKIVEEIVGPVTDDDEPTLYR
jgi:hypothetical protein